MTDRPLRDLVTVQPVVGAEHRMQVGAAVEVHGP